MAIDTCHVEVLLSTVPTFPFSSITMSESLSANAMAVKILLQDLCMGRPGPGPARPGNQLP
jgi:hypothetical protein